MPFSNSFIQFERIGRVALVHGNVKFTGSGQQNYAIATETIPAGFRPLGANTAIVFSMGGNFALLADENGKINMLGDPNYAYACCTGSWATEDPFPT